MRSKGPVMRVREADTDMYAAIDLAAHRIERQAQRYRELLSGAAQKDFRFHHVSTDEVFGELGPEGRFVESTPYAPNSPYAASKASADHFVRAWMRTFGLPILVSNCCVQHCRRAYCQEPQAA